MRNARLWAFLGSAWLGIVVAVQVVEAEEPEISVTLEPIRYAFVKGDQDKFRAMHWWKENYVGGVKNFSGKLNLPDGFLLSTNGHALIDQGDIGADLSVTKESLGFIKLNYSTFRKYYDKTGGTYYRFASLSGVDMYKDPKLDIGKFNLETGLTIEGLPQITFFYTRDTKRGTKSRLSWTSTVVGGVTKDIGPSWQDIKEHTDTFGLKADQELAGFALKGKQEWEFTRAELFREEDSLETSPSPTSSNSKIRRQWQDPQANLANTTMSAERNFLDNKLFWGTAYHYAQLRNDEMQVLSEFNNAGVLTDFSHAEQTLGFPRADNKYHTHTWVSNTTLSPWSWLSIGTRLKAEVLRRRSNSIRSLDETGPDGVADSIEQNITDNKAVRWGEGFSIRYTGIPRTALYNELEFEQNRILLREDQKDLLASTIFSRETVSKIWRGVWTMGGQYEPWHFLNVTAQVRHRQNNIDYDNQQHVTSGSSARSAFFDGQNIGTEEFEGRATLKPCRWFRTSFRYQLRGDKYATRTNAGDNIVKTGMLSNIYTYDVTVQPLRELSSTISFSRQTAATWTPARFSPTTSQIPTYNANVNTALLSTDYVPKENITVTNTLQYSRAKNFNDFTGIGMPYGTDFTQLDFTTGVTWSLAPTLSLGTEYGFYSYVPTSLTDIDGGYHAHVIWFDVSKKF